LILSFQLQPTSTAFLARDSICLARYMLYAIYRYRLFVRLSVMQTGGSVKNG